MTIRSQLLRGTLNVLILRALAGRKLHGYGVTSHIERRTGDALRIEDGALYQALHRMQERGWIDSEWGHAESGKRARFYWLTSDGKRQLARETSDWSEYVAAVSKMLRSTGEA